MQPENSKAEIDDAEVEAALEEAVDALRHDSLWTNPSDRDAYRSFSTRPLPTPNVTHELEAMLPNLRDLSVSSGLPNLRPGRLYRSARPFCSSAIPLRRVMYDLLGVHTVIDLRDDDLVPLSKSEAHSRELLMYLYQLHVPDDPLVEFKVPIRSLRALRRLERDQRRMDRQVVGWKQQGDPRPLVDKYLEMRKSRMSRRFFVVNILETEEMKKRIMDTVVSSNLLPFVAFCRVTDKISGSSLAPYYFCRYIVGPHEISESYIEMLKYCGRRFFEVLIHITAEEPPILFHCTLGKDRTGLVSMLVLFALGATESMIIFDYNLTEYAHQKYQQFNRRFIASSGLSEGFSSASAECMRLTINWLKETFGGIGGYLDSIGFHEGHRQALRSKYLIDPTD